MNLDDALATTTPEPVTAVSLVPGRHVHAWSICPCGAQRDLTAPRRGRSADRLGKDQERRIEARYGPRKIGEFGDSIDLLGKVWKWQSKATRQPMSAWLRSVDRPIGHVAPAIVTEAERAMRSLRPDLRSLVIQSFVRAGVPTADRIWVRCEDWRGEHGYSCGLHPDECWDWMVMDGSWFLDVNGEDRP